jgi:outer membrane receptor protein involved in Fe transport
MPVKILSVLLLLFSVAATSIAQNPATAGKPGILRGAVGDAKTDAPLEFVNVMVKEAGTGAATAENGGYIIKGIPPGTYTVTFSLVGYEPLTREGVVLRAGEETILHVALKDQSVQVGDVTVYGASLRGERVTDAPASVTVLSPAEIRLGAVSGQVPKLLETQAGVDIVQSGLNDYNVNVRGFNSSLNRRLLVLLDGRDLAVAFLGSQEWNGLSVPVEDLGTVELIRGPGSALYGANAFNGVMNILTPRPQDITGGKVSVSGGEMNTARIDARYAGVAGAWSYKVNGGRIQGDTWTVSRLSLPFEYGGFNPFLNMEVVPVRGGKVASTYGSGRVDFDYPRGGHAVLEGGVTQVENEVLVTGIGRVQVPKAVKPWGRASYVSDRLSIQLWGAGRNSLEPQRSLATGLPLEERSFIGQVDVQYRITALEDRLFVVLGGAQKYQHVGTQGTLTLASHTDNLSGIYLQAEYKLLESIKTVFAARWDRSTLHASQLSPKAAVVWTPLRGHSLRATFNRAFQAPNYSELFLYVKHPIRNLAYIGNDRLKVERITGFEIGYKGIIENVLFLNLDAYYNQLRDFITDLAPAVNPAFPGQVVLPGDSVLRTVWSYGNAGSVNEQGLEFGADYQVTDWLRIAANYALFDFSVSGANENDVLLPNAPRYKINGGVTVTRDGFTGGVSVKYVPGFDWAAGIFKGPVPAYTLVNLDASYQLTSSIELGLNVTNLLNREHYQLFGGSLLERRAVAGMTVHF